MCRLRRHGAAGSFKLPGRAPVRLRLASAAPHAGPTGSHQNTSVTQHDSSSGLVKHKYLIDKCPIFHRPGAGGRPAE